MASAVKASKLINLLLTHEGDGYVYATIGQTCTKQLLQAKEKQYGKAMGNGYYQLNGDYDEGLCARWLGQWVCDCSGLIKWGRKELSGVWRDVSAQGTYDQCEENQRGPIKTMPLQPGVAVFMYSKSKGRMGHVGLYIGNGKVIEARGVRYGVVVTKLKDRAWGYWGKLDWLDYNLAVEGGKATPGTDADAGDNTDEKPDDLPILKYIRKDIMKTKYVLKAQKLLLKWSKKCLVKHGADGEFGTETRDAVKAFQKARKLKKDGIIGPKTWDELLELE